jgi:hypothetical protein
VSETIGGPYSFALDQMRNSAASAYRRWWEGRSPLPPVDRTACLYHYTSAEGLTGILESRALWATDTAFLNDWTEVRYAADPLVQHMTRHIEAFLADHPPERWRMESEKLARARILGAAREFIANFTSNWDEIVPQNDLYVRGATFVACLSGDHDQLGQWRGYGKGGYAIGFRRELLAAAAPVFGAVQYGEDAIEKLCDHVLEHFDNLKISSAEDDTRLDPSRNDFWSRKGYVEAVCFCLPQIALIKHNSFAHENEWRLVVPRYDLDYANIAVRSVGGRHIPYVNCHFADDAIAEIVIGPGGDLHSERAVRTLLAAKGYNSDTIQISQSSAPFRG